MNTRHQAPAGASRHAHLSITSAMSLVMLLTLLPAVPAHAAVDTQSVTALQAQVAALQARVGQLERQLTRVMKLVDKDSGPAPAPAATVPAARAVIPVREGATPGPSIKLGGRIKVDGIYNSRSTNYGSYNNQSDLSFAVGNIPLDGKWKQNKVNFSARETRLWVTAQVPTAAQTLGAYVEMDFSSADDSGNEKVSNSYVPRLRHAYVDYGDFTAGQTWTTFMNVSAFPDMNDTGGPAGIINVRQPMLRYHHDLEWVRVYLALEQPESALSLPSGARSSFDDDLVPDMVGKLEFSGDWGNWSLAGLARQLRIVDGGAHTAWGGAVSASGRINVFDSDNVRFALSYGNALGRYLSLNADDDAVLDVDHGIHLTEMFGAYVSYQHWWSEALRSSLTLGYSRSHHAADVSQFAYLAEVNETLFSSHINLIWNLTTAASVGLEWIHGERRLWNDRKGSLDRLQFTSMFRF